MRILLVHNYYGSSAPSGENKVFEAELRALSEHGFEVSTFTRHSDEIRGKGIRGLIKGALCTIGNPFSERQLTKKIKAFKPDVVHFHNQFPLISPLALSAAHKSGARVVMTLHNYRLVCAGGISMRGSCVCDACFRLRNRNQVIGIRKKELGSRRLSVWPAIKGRCYRGSMAATLPLAINIWLYRHCWDKWVDQFIVLSEFQKKIMVECGFTESKMVVKPNFLFEKDADCGSRERNNVLFLGRLSDEKGVQVLIQAWNKMGQNAPTLHIAGDGARRTTYEKMAKNDRIKFLGNISSEKVSCELAQAVMLVVPSLWYEGLPTTILEAFRQSVPVVATDLGPLPSIVKDGVCGRVVRAGDVDDLVNVIKTIGDKCWAVYSQNARKEFELHYSVDAHISCIRSVYGASSAE